MPPGARPARRRRRVQPTISVDTDEPSAALAREIDELPDEEGSATRLLGGPAHQYHRALMAELTSGRHERLGDEILAAQQAFAQSGPMPELLSIYHLLGDPATRIRYQGEPAVSIAGPRAR